MHWSSMLRVISTECLAVHWPTIQTIIALERTCTNPVPTAKLPRTSTTHMLSHSGTMKKTGLITIAGYAMHHLIIHVATLLK